MFSGIISDIGSVSEVRQEGDLVQISIGASSLNDVEVGESIAINGVCLTAVLVNGNGVRFDISTETLRKTTLGLLRVGATVNIERALRVGDRLSGHFVLGHVDGVIAIKDIVKEGNTVKFEFSLPTELRPYVVAKGSIALNGTSLTVGEVSGAAFSVYVVPHTLAATTFATARKGDEVNVEIDCLARYVRGGEGAS